MNRNYIALAVIAIGLAIGILIMDRDKQVREIDPELLAVAYNDPSRFLSIDEVTDRLVQKDPGLILIDVRPADQFKLFAIPGAVNIPIDSLFTPSSMDLLKRKELDKVLCSNSDVWSDQAWLLCTRLEMPSVFVLEGGVNNWFHSIVQATEPPVTAPQDEHDIYSFRLAANQYFFGKKEMPVAEQEKTAKPKTPVAKQAPVLRSEPAAETGGGC
jgi:sulfur-carrier protein adenylyltransferase/sulfurtransferase